MVLRNGMRLACALVLSFVAAAGWSRTIEEPPTEWIEPVTGHHVIRRIDLTTGLIETVLGTGERGDGPEPEPRRCRLSRPHALIGDGRGHLYVADSEAHRIRVLGTTP